jgi:dihydroflavonol-4-reductase
VVVVQPTAPVGAWDARPSATGRRILAALAEQVTPYPPGGINHVPVVDAAAGHLLAAVRGRPGQTYILGHRQGNLGHEAFLRMVALAAGVQPRPAPTPPAGRQSALLEGLTADPARAIAELGLPQSDLAAAFRDAVMWYRTEAARRSPRRQGGERFDAWLHSESGG